MRKSFEKKEELLTERLHYKQDTDFTRQKIAVDSMNVLRELDTVKLGGATFIPWVCNK